MPTISERKTHIAWLREQLQAAEQALGDIQRRCQHHWSEPRYNPIVTEAGSDPGDPPDSMVQAYAYSLGVDRRLPCSWPRSERPSGPAPAACAKRLRGQTRTPTTGTRHQLGVEQPMSTNNDSLGWPVWLLLVMLAICIAVAMVEMWNPGTMDALVEKALLLLHR